MPELTIETTAGRLLGLAVHGDVVSFRGIPYATPPVGALRWRPPERWPSWTGVRDATTFAADAVQVSGIRASRASGMSEDCLYVNVWAPRAQRAGGWPVIVWSGGGGFSTGGGAFAVEDLGRLAARGAVCVSFTYRLGAFGFLAHPSLSAESPHGVSGNYGLMDHVAALKWVRENIEAFGGDRGRISYLAESSGAAAGLLMLTTPLEHGLFDRAVFLSPGSVTPLLSLADAEQVGARLEGDADALRAISANELLAQTKMLAAPASNLSVARPLRPIVDGRLITTDRAFATGAFDAVPVVIGTNEDEGRFFTRRMAIASTDQFEDYLSDTFGERASAAAALYPAATDAEVGAAVAAAYGDVSINFPAERLARAFAERQARTYRFVYTYRHADTTQPPTHSEEAETLLDTRPHVTSADGEMARVAQDYLLAFADGNDPAPAGLPAWPRFDAGERRHLTLEFPPTTGANWREEQMAFVGAVN